MCIHSGRSAFMALYPTVYEGLMIACYTSWHLMVSQNRRHCNARKMHTQSLGHSVLLFPCGMPNPQSLFEGSAGHSWVLRHNCCTLNCGAAPKMWNASRFCVSSLRRGHANLLCIVPILVYVLPKQVQLWLHFFLFILQECATTPGYKLFHSTLLWCLR